MTKLFYGIINGGVLTLPRLNLGRIVPKITLKNFNLLSWIIVPLLLVFSSLRFTTDYLIKSDQNTYKSPSFLIASAKDKNPLNPLPQTNFKWQDTGLVTLWFDDAWQSQHKLGLPLLREYGFKGAIAVPTYLVGSVGYMEWRDVFELQNNGWEITSHTRSHHCSLKEETDETLNYEIVGAKEDLQTLGLNSDNFVTPCGVDDARIRELIRKNYRSLRGSGDGLNSIPVKDPYAIQVQTVGMFTSTEEVKSWLEQAKLEKKWLILMFHRIDQTKDIYDVGPIRFKNVLEQVKESNLPVVLPSQVLDIK